MIRQCGREEVPRYLQRKTGNIDQALIPHCISVVISRKTFRSLFTLEWTAGKGKAVKCTASHGENGKKGVNGESRAREKEPKRTTVNLPGAMKLGGSPAHSCPNTLIL